MAERRMSATEARVHFGELLDSVTQKGEVVYVERAGVPQVVVVPINVWKLHQRRDPWAEALRELEEYWAYIDEEVKAGRILEVDVDIDEMERQSREERDERILGGMLGQ